MLKHEKNVRELIGSLRKKNFPSRGPEKNVFFFFFFFFFWDFPRVLQNDSRFLQTVEDSNTISIITWFVNKNQNF